MEDGKCLKVTLVFENTTYIATGRDAEAWKDRVDALESLGFNHGLFHGEGFKWTKIKKS